MASIKIRDIKFDNSDFFANDKGLMKDLSKGELNILGGSGVIVTIYRGNL